MSPKRRNVLRRARTAASLPGRVVECENRCDALERHVADQLAGMRAELGEIRRMLERQVETDIDTTELVGQLLRRTEHRLDAIEEEVGIAIDDARPTGLLPEQGSGSA